MNRRWYEAVPPVSCEIACNGELHTISWDRGRLRLHDHDVEAEGALVALGGEPPACMQIVEAWRGFGDETGRMEILMDWTADRRRWPETWSFTFRAAGFGSRMRQAVIGHSAMPRPMLRMVLSGLPAVLHDRRVLGVVAAMFRTEPRTATKIVETSGALGGRAVPAIEECVRAWRRGIGPYLTVECFAIAPNETPYVDGYSDASGGAIAASLPATWLLDVWSRGIACVDGCFIMRVLSERLGFLRVLAVRFERQGFERSVPVSGPATVYLGADDHWTLRWDR